MFEPLSALLHSWAPSFAFFFFFCRRFPPRWKNGRSLGHCNDSRKMHVAALAALIATYIVINGALTMSITSVLEPGLPPSRVARKPLRARAPAATGSDSITLLPLLPVVDGCIIAWLHVPTLLPADTVQLFSFSTSLNCSPWKPPEACYLIAQIHTTLEREKMCRRCSEAMIGCGCAAHGRCGGGT